MVDLIIISSQLHFLQQYFPKQKPTIIKYRDYKKIDLSYFRPELNRKLTEIEHDEGNILKIRLLLC